MKRHTRSLKIMETINMTPLLDVTFLLLIAFMLIAPELKHGIKINLPKTTGTRITEKEAFIITVRDDGRYYLNGKLIDSEDLILRAREHVIRDPDAEILLEGDKEVQWGNLLEIFGALKEAGIEKVQLRTEPKD